MFAIRYHESMPKSGKSFKMSCGGNYYYDSIVINGRFLHEASWSYSMPIPFGPLSTKEIPIKMVGLIRDQPYIASDEEMIEAGTIEQFVPVRGTVQAMHPPSLGDGRCIPLPESHFVPGPATHTYTWRTHHTKTISGVARWKYRGQWYSREWSKEIQYDRVHKRTVSATDEIRLLPRKAIRHLHHCDHSYVTGELWLASREMGFDPIKPVQIQFQSTWPFVTKSGIWIGDPGDRIVDLPADYSKLAGGIVSTVPRLLRVFTASRDTSVSPSVDYIAPCMAGVVYVGQKLFPRVSRYEGIGHVYCVVDPKAPSGEGFQNLTGNLRYYAWLYNPKESSRYALLATKTVTVPIPAEYNQGLYEEIVHRTFSDQGAQLTWSIIKYKSNLTFAETPTGEVNPKRLLASAYERLWTAVLPPSIETTYKRVVGRAGQDALLNTKVLNINSLMYLKDFTTIRELCESYADLLRRGINPKTVSGAYLASHYGVRLSIQDTREIISRVKREIDGLAQEYQYSYGSSFASIDGPVGKIDIKGNVSVLFTLVDSRTFGFLRTLARWDLLPTPRVIWDMIPYSFVLDWIIPVGSASEVFDRLITEGTINQKRCCWSQKTVANMSAELAIPALLEQGVKWYGCTSELKLVGYRRAYQKYAPSPDALLDLSDISPRWSDSRLYEISSLTIQRLS